VMSVLVGEMLGRFILFRTAIPLWFRAQSCLEASLRQADESCFTFEVAAERDTFSRKTLDQSQLRRKLDREPRCFCWTRGVCPRPGCKRYGTSHVAGKVDRIKLQHHPADPCVRTGFDPQRLVRCFNPPEKCVAILSEKWQGRVSRRYGWPFAVAHAHAYL